MNAGNINWEEFELITKQCIEIICKDNVEFICSGRNCKINKRQFDVLFRWKNPLKEAKIAIECKHWNKKVGISEIDAFTTKCLHCNIDSKFIISKIGFTKPAIEQAKKCNIELIQLRDFHDDDFKDCFKNKILGIEVNMHIIMPKISSNIIVNIDAAFYSQEEQINMLQFVNKNISFMPGVVSLYFSNDVIKDITECIPNRITNMTNNGFSVKSEIISDNERKVVYEKILECYSIKIYDKCVRTKNVLVNITESFDDTTTHIEKFSIDYKNEIRKAGYLIAKSLIQKNNHVLDINKKSIIDN